MRKGKFFTKVKKATATCVVLAMIAGMIPMQQAKAADNSPYVISQGRMIYASSSVSNSDPTYVNDGSKGTRWESGWTSNIEWIYVDLGKVAEFPMMKKTGEIFMKTITVRVEMKNSTYRVVQDI